MNSRYDMGMRSVYGHTSISFLKKCQGFHEAKAGNLLSAAKVVEQCIKRSVIDNMRQHHPDAVVLPVLSDASMNKLPLALALETGLPVCDNVSLCHEKERKKMSAIERLLYKPLFKGKIVRGDYIIVDDIITQGGVVNSMREFVTGQGGNVVGVMALAYSVGSRHLEPDKEQIHMLLNKFGYDLTVILQSYDIAEMPQSLTGSQVSYLLRFSSCERLVERICKVR